MMLYFWDFRIGAAIVKGMSVLSMDVIQLRREVNKWLDELSLTFHKNFRISLIPFIALNLIKKMNSSTQTKRNDGNGLKDLSIASKLAHPTALCEQSNTKRIHKILNKIKK